MESYEATRAVFSRVQSIDPENASKIMGYILLHHGEKDMIRFAYGPETLILSIVNRAKTDLGLLSNTSSAPVVSPISNPIAISRPNPLHLSLPSPRLNTNGFNPSSPSSPSIWATTTLPHSVSPNSSSNNHSLSYAAVVNGSCNASNGGYSQVGFSENFVDEGHLHDQNLPFLNECLVAKNGGDFFEQSPVDLAMSPVENHPHFLHRRSVSFNEACFGSDDSSSGFGYKPCLYFSRGFCKNGSSCKFGHGGGGFSDSDAFDQYPDEILRSKIAQQQRLAHLMVNLPYSKLNFLQTDAQRSALMMGEEFHKLNRARIARNEFLRGDSNPGSRQIYLTFPADSTFKEEDVSEYFSRFGPVQDVRIPYQQKRMFGFVTFVYPETVNMILAKGNPHFVCDSRVLVKPYKEKGKLPDKKQQQQLERGDFSCSSPSGLDSREPFDFPLGGRMFYSPEEMLLKRKLEEQAGLQQALELQSRRMMNLQLLDLKNHQHQLNISVGSPIPSPNFSQVLSNHNALPPHSDGFSQDVSEENKGTPTEASDQQLAEGVGGGSCDNNNNGNVQNKDENSKNDECEIMESLEHILPDSLFASPTKSGAVKSSAFSTALVEPTEGSTKPGSNNDSSMPASSPLNIAPHKSCFFEMPRLSSGHGALGM